MATVVILGSSSRSLIEFRGDLIGTLVRAEHRVVAMAPLMDDNVRARLSELGASVCEVHIDNQSMNPLELLFSARSIRRSLLLATPDVILAYTIKPITLGAIFGPDKPVRFLSLITGLGFAFTNGTFSIRRVLAKIIAVIL